MAPMTNITITVPEGTSNHGDPDILCVPSKWTDILLFYAVNYLAHAVTVKSLPGEKLEETAYYIAMALIYPYSGLLRGIEAIIRRAAWYRGNELQQAARAGALCVVVRDRTWKPLNGQIVSGCEICEIPDNLKKGHSTVQNAVEDAVTLGQAELNSHTTASWFALMPASFYEGLENNRIVGKNRLVHGDRYLPPGYSLAYLPSNTKIETYLKGKLANVLISSFYSLTKSLVSIVQVFFASATIYRTRGDQIERYGYAAFGLTVLPYIIMSIVNLVGNLFTPDFANMYLVRSPEMAEAEHPERGGWFDGVIGIVNDTPNDRGISVRFDKAEGGFLIHAVDTTATIDGQVEDAIDNENGIVPTTNDISQVKKDPESGPEKMDHVNIVHLEPGGTPQNISARDLSTSQRSYSSVEFSKPSNLLAEDQRKLISERLFQISNDQTRSAEDPRKLTLERLFQIRNDQLRSVEGVFVNSANKRREGLARELPSKAGIAEMSVRPDFHLKVPAASNFKYDGSQAWSAGRAMGWRSLAFLMAGIPLAVIGLLTHFKTGNSTKPQRVWIMGWLVFGTFLGVPLQLIIANDLASLSEDPANTLKSKVKWTFKIQFLLSYAAFAIGGFVVVGQMLKAYGNCIKIS